MSLVAYYKLDGNTNDSEGSNDLTDITNVTFPVGKKGLAGQYNGTDSRSFLSTFTLGTDPIFTVSMWIKRTGDATSKSFWGLGGGATNDGISGYGGSGEVNEIGIDLWGTTTFQTGILYPLDEWVHVTWVKSATTFTTSTIKIYVNGALCENLRTFRNGGSAPALVSGLTLGSNTHNISGYYAPGLIDEVKIFDTALNRAEVADLYDPNYQKLLSQYDFDGDVLDSSGNHNDGTLTGGTFITGKEDQALSLDGISDFATFPSQAVNSLTGSLSISFWAKIEAADETAILWQPNEGGDIIGDYNINIYLPITGNTIYWDCGYDPTVGDYNRISKALDTSYIGDDTFHHWVFQLNGTSDLMEIYLDGSLWYSAASKGYPFVNSCNPLYLGNRTSATDFWGGTIDNLKIRDTPMSADEVLKEYNPEYDGLLAHYKFDGDITDSGPFGFDGDAAVGVTWETGKVDQSVALTFGLGSYITIPHNDILSDLVFGKKSIFTISAWFKMTAWTSYGSLINKLASTGSSWSDTTTGIWTHSSGISFVIGANVDSNPSGSSTIIAWQPSLNEWHHICCVADGARMSLYGDGSLIKQGTIHSYTRTENTSKILIGPRQTTTDEGFPGQVDDLKIYGIALTAPEAKAGYDNIPLSIKQEIEYENRKGLIAHYSCQEKQFYAFNYLGSGIAATTAWSAHESSAGWVGTTETGIRSEFDTMIFSLNADTSAYAYTKDEILDDNLGLGGTLCCFSIYVRRLEGPEEGQIRMYDSVGSYTYQRINVTTEFQRFYMTKTFGASPTRMFVMVDGNHQGYATGTYEFHSAQLEVGDVPSNFTKAISAGVLLDSSGNENNSVMGRNGDTTIHGPLWVEDHPWTDHVGSYQFLPSIYNWLWLPPRLMDGLLDFTFNCWIKPEAGQSNSFLLSGASSLQNNELLFGTDTSGHLLCYMNHVLGPTSLATVSWDEWQMVTLTREGHWTTIYLDAVEIVSSVTSSVALNVEGLVLGQDQDSVLGGFSSTQCLKGLMSEISIYNKALSSLEVEQLKNWNSKTRISLDENGNLWTDVPIKTNITNKLLVDPREWALNTYGGQGSWSDNGDTAENLILKTTGPWGETANAWWANPTTTSGADGGWNKQFEIDPSKAHRFSVFVKKIGSTDGSTYLGCDSKNTLNLAGTSNTNPYFWSGDLPSLDTWYLMVGVLHEYGYGTVDSGIAGTYNMSGVLTTQYAEFKSNGGVMQNFRSYLFYVTDTLAHQYFMYPRVDIMDGTEPSIAQLVAGLDMVEHRDFLNQNGKFLINQSDGTLNMSRESIDFPSLEFDNALEVPMRFEDVKASLKGEIYGQFEVLLPSSEESSIYSDITYGDGNYGEE